MAATLRKSQVQKRTLLRSSSLFASHVFRQLIDRKWHPCTARTNVCMATLPPTTRSGRLIDLAEQRKPMLRVPGQYPEDSSRLVRKPSNILVVVLASIISQRTALTGETRPEGAVLGRFSFGRNTTRIRHGAGDIIRQDRHTTLRDHLRNGICKSQSSLRVRRTTRSSSASRACMIGAPLQSRSMLATFVLLSRALLHRLAKVSTGHKQLLLQGLL